MTGATGAPLRCALLEYNSYHDEVLPTLVWLLNRLDIRPDVYMVKRSARRRPFGAFEGLRYRSRSIERMRWLGGLPFRLRRYDLLIVNSLEPMAVLERVDREDTPVLAIVHNPHLTGPEPAYQAFFAKPSRRALVLGRQIAERGDLSLGPLSWLAPVVLASTPARPTPGAPTTFVVSGNVEYVRRNYASLLEAASALRAEGREFRVRIVGRTYRPDGRAFREALRARGLTDRFELSSGEIDHPTYFGLVASSDFSLPLLDTTDERFRPYLESKLTASVPFALGLGVPLVAHAAVARAYDVAGTGPTYEDGALPGAMREAVDTRPEQRVAWRESVDAKRAALLAASETQLREAIAAVTR